MTMSEWLKYVLLKLVTLGKIDTRKEKRRGEVLSEILRLAQQISTGDWEFERNKVVVKGTIPYMVHVGEEHIDSILDFFIPSMSKYEADSSREPYMIYETWPYFCSFGGRKGDELFIAFHSGEEGVLCRGSLVVATDTNSDIIIEELIRRKDKVDIDTLLLNFFEDLRRRHFEN